MTVSNVANGRYHLMRPETRARVESVIRRLGYRPHITARGLRSARRFLIGMLVVDESPAFLVDSFTTQAIAGLSNFLGERGYGLLLQGVHPNEFDNSIFVQDARTDGLCVFLSGTAGQRAAMIRKLAKLNEPLVLLQETVDSIPADTCLVRQDDYGGGKALAKHLLDKGARDFLMLLTKVEWSAVHQRELGVRSALQDAPHSTTFRTLTCNHSNFAMTQKTLQSALNLHGLPDAIIAANDQMGIAAMKLLVARGLNVPGDILITGFNAFDFWQYSDPTLTTIHSAAIELGERSGAELLRRLQTGRFKSKTVLLPVSLEIGGATMSDETKNDYTRLSRDSRRKRGIHKSSSTFQ